MQDTSLFVSTVSRQRACPVGSEKEIEVWLPGSTERGGRESAKGGYRLGLEELYRRGSDESG